MQLFIFSSCTSCRKARDLLVEHGISFTERNMNTDPLTTVELLNILAKTSNGTTEIMSKRSQEVKSLDIEIEELSLNEWMELVQEHPGILRRPLLLTPDNLIVGYNKEEYDGVIRKYGVSKQEEDLVQV